MGVFIAREWHDVRRADGTQRWEIFLKEEKNGLPALAMRNWSACRPFRSHTTAIFSGIVVQQSNQQSTHDDAPTVLGSSGVAINTPTALLASSSFTASTVTTTAVVVVGFFAPSPRRPQQQQRPPRLAATRRSPLHPHAKMLAEQSRAVSLSLSLSFSSLIKCLDHRLSFTGTVIISSPAHQLTSPHSATVVELGQVQHTHCWTAG
jgi:hypothetical protein